MVSAAMARFSGTLTGKRRPEFAEMLLAGVAVSDVNPLQSAQNNDRREHLHRIPQIGSQSQIKGKCTSESAANGFESRRCGVKSPR